MVALIIFTVVDLKRVLAPNLEMRLQPVHPMRSVSKDARPAGTSATADVAAAADESEVDAVMNGMDKSRQEEPKRTTFEVEENRSSGGSLKSPKERAASLRALTMVVGSVGRMSASVGVATARAARQRARNVHQGDLARAVVYYASIWTFAFVCKRIPVRFCLTSSPLFVCSLACV